jgi:phage terminase large subunit-like protein
MDADPYSAETIAACNPAAGVFLDLDDIIKEAEQAKRVPMFEARYRNLRLNQRIDGNAGNRVVTRPIWEACEADISLSELRGRRCFGGLDLSGKHDLTSLVLAFPDDEVDLGYDILSFFWTPEGQLEARKMREQELFRNWIGKGHIQTVPGPVIKFRYMAETLGDLLEQYDIRCIGFDRWRITDFQVDLTDAGLGEDEIPLEPFGQGFKDISPAIEYFVELALSGRLRHDGNPVMNSCVANAITVSDPAGNLKVDKDKSNKASSIRIDGLLSAIMAVGTAKRFEEEPTGSTPWDNDPDYRIGS